METISPNTKRLVSGWLTIVLNCQRQGQALTFTIVFRNNDHTEQELAFSNRAHKAELLGLLLEDATGQRVMPKHNLLIKPLKPDADIHVLAGGSEMSHELSGVLNDAELVFTGARYLLQAEQTYQARFRYLGVTSNAVSFVV